MVSKLVLVVLVAVVLVVAAVTALVGLRPEGAASSTETTSTSSRGSGAGFVKGLAFSPLTNDAVGINDFFAKAGGGNGIVEWAGDWEQLGGTAPGTVAQLASQHGMKTMVVVQFFSQGTGGLLRPLNSSNEQRYLNLAAGFATQYKPAYFGVGIEVNILYEKNQTAFEEFLPLYSHAYDAIKEASPGTKVFTVFQLEKMNGLGGGLYGGTNDPGKSEWQLLSDFSKDDVLAFTTYPSLVFHSPADIPAGYFSGIAGHSNRTVGFTEIGWHSGAAPGGWDGNASAQNAFVDMFLPQARSLGVSFGVWSFLYDPAAQVPFNSMGMIYDNGTQKAAWGAWLGA